MALSRDSEPLFQLQRTEHRMYRTRQFKQFLSRFAFEVIGNILRANALVSRIHQFQRGNNSHMAIIVNISRIGQLIQNLVNAARVHQTNSYYFMIHQYVLESLPISPSAGSSPTWKKMVPKPRLFANKRLYIKY
jgi:hypothetical protein